MPDAVERFSREAAAAARVRSPHVVQVFDHGVSDDTPYIVMELLKGEDLAHKLERDTRLSPSETVSIITQIGKALERAHAEGIVHRDIKPANVFLVADPDGEPLVKVLDFGLAKHGRSGLSDLTENGAIFGTPHYLSPEQAGNARAVTPQSDLWSVAVIAYQCLTGTRPYQGESIIELCAALAATTFAAPSSVCPDLPPALDAWFTRAFQRDPTARFGSASELAQTLAAALSAPLEAAPPVAVPLEPSPSPRTPVTGRRAVAGVLVAAAVIAGGFVAFHSAARPVATAESATPANTMPTPQSAPAAVTPAESAQLQTTQIALASTVTPSKDIATPVTVARPARVVPPLNRRTRPDEPATPRVVASTTPPPRPADDLFSDPKR